MSCNEKRKNNKEVDNTHKSKRSRKEEMIFNQDDEVLVQEDQEQEIPRINEEVVHINEEEQEIQEDENKADESLLSTLDDERKGGSLVWKHFDKFKDEKGIIWAKCRYCG